MHKVSLYNNFIICLYMFRALCAHHQEVKIVLYSIWYHHTCARYGHLQVWWYQMLYNTILTSWWWAHQCSEHVEGCDKSYYITRFCALSWLISRKKDQSVNVVSEIIPLFIVKVLAKHTNTHCGRDSEIFVYQAENFCSVYRTNQIKGRLGKALSASVV